MKFLWAILLFPADILIWFQFTFPKNMGEAIGAKRRMNSLPARIIMAIFGWVCILLILLMILAFGIK